MNESARKQLALAELRRMVASGQVKPLDRFRNPITEGCMVLYRIAVDAVYSVQSVRPSLDSSHPLGTLIVELKCTMQVPVPAGVPMPTMIVVGGIPPTEYGTDSADQRDPVPDRAGTGSPVQVPDSDALGGPVSPSDKAPMAPLSEGGPAEGTTMSRLEGGTEFSGQKPEDGTEFSSPSGDGKDEVPGTDFSGPRLVIP